MNSLTDKFNSVVREDEKVLWVGAVNKPAFVKSNLRFLFLLGLIPHVAIITLGLTFPYNFVLLILGIFDFIPIFIGALHTVISLIAWLICFIYIKKLSNNTYFCITNKQIIKRTGTYANDYKRYPLNNIGAIELDANVYDSKEYPESATLKIKIKNFTAGSAEKTLDINNLLDAHGAYKILSKYSDDEAVKVKQV